MNRGWRSYSTATSSYCLYVIEKQDSDEEVERPADTSELSVIMSQTSTVREKQDSGEEVERPADTSELSVIKSQTSTVRSVLQFTVIITFEYLIHLQKT